MVKQHAISVDPRQAVIGYIVNSGLSEGLYRPIYDIQTKLIERFPGAIWGAPRQSLHITLMDWLAPLVDYGHNKDELFRSIEDEYTAVLTKALKQQAPILVTFDTIEVHPAAIIVKGHDDGSYSRIRDQFLSEVELLPGTKPPPAIIHTTIAKFLKPINVNEVADFVRHESLYAQEEILEFRLARETRVFMVEYEILRQFKLNS